MNLNKKNKKTQIKKMNQQKKKKNRSRYDSKTRLKKENIKTKTWKIFLI